MEKISNSNCELNAKKDFGAAETAGTIAKADNKPKLFEKKDDAPETTGSVGLVETAGTIASAAPVETAGSIASAGGASSSSSGGFSAVC